MAARLGWPVQLLQKLTTSKEFVRWKVWLEKEPNEFNPLFYYLANIVAEVRRGHVDNPRAVDLDQFLLQFEAKKTPTAPSQMSPEKLKASIAQRKMAWGMGVGLFDQNKKTLPKPPVRKVKNGTNSKAANYKPRDSIKRHQIQSRVEHAR